MFSKYHIRNARVLAIIFFAAIHSLLCQVLQLPSFGIVCEAYTASSDMIHNLDSGQIYTQSHRHWISLHEAHHWIIQLV